MLNYIFQNMLFSSEQKQWLFFNKLLFCLNFHSELPVVTRVRKRVMWMMFALVVVFIVCWLPFQLFMIIRYSYQDNAGTLDDQQIVSVFSLKYYLLVFSNLKSIQNFHLGFNFHFNCVEINIGRR